MKSYAEELKAKAIAFRKLALDDGVLGEGSKYRRAYALRMGEPILKNVAEQSSIQEIFVEDPIPVGEHALYQVDIDISPSTDKYTGAASQLTCWEHPGLGPVAQQFMESTELIIPPKEFEEEAGFNRTHALHARFSFKDRQQEKIKDGMLGKIESTGWGVIQAVAGNASFPAAQKVNIAAGAAGTTKFSRQLFSEMIKATLDIGLIEKPEYKLAMHISTTSFKELCDWDIATEFDISSRAELPDSEKEDIAKIDARGYVAVYRGVRIKALRRLGTGDVVADHDYCYLTIQATLPEFFARPIFPAPNGEKIEMIDDPVAFYSSNEIKTKARYSENYAILDARGLVLGDIDRS